MKKKIAFLLAVLLTLCLSTADMEATYFLESQHKK